MIVEQQPPVISGATESDVLVRPARVEGQVRGVTRMVRDDRHCLDVLTQISAIHAALDQVGLRLLDRRVRAGLQGQTLDDDQVDELMEQIARMLGR